MALAAGGEAGRLAASVDWSKTPLGKMEDWPRSLQAAASLVLRHGFSMNVSWGPKLIQIYNDATIPIMGRKHPAAMGQPVSETWPEIWDFLEPTLRRVWETGEALMIKGNRFLIDRLGFLEEMFVDISYSTVLGDDGKVAGILSTSIESTDRALGERRLRTLKELSSAFVVMGGEADVYPRLAEVCEKNPYDLPFTLLYLCDADGRSARLAASSGIKSGTAAAPELVKMDEGEWGSVFKAACEGETRELSGLAKRFGSLERVNEQAPSDKALVVSIVLPGEQKPFAILAVGVSSYLQLDDEYREFLAFIGREIGAGISSLRALRQAQERADKLAEIDKAKTLFLSNVSHEFRTPLTLILGPLEDLLSGQAPENPRALLETMFRNAQRLLNLVNALLDFSRLEAGRLRASFEPTRLDELTRDLASLFESACLRAGLELVVETPALPEPVYIDRDMWEKIVVNLLSNALKFTLRGEIRLTLGAEEGKAVLRVADTGSGIPPKSLPHLFERFYRVPETRARTHEGAGI
ncbi:MAG: GAF domain-containing sensor histidine kinase, partial [Spirochaetia bacterium]|nr:GAF domain-containing sensor histidine kinase [Spirochaetia bacterium]